MHANSLKLQEKVFRRSVGLDIALTADEFAASDIAGLENAQ